MISNRTKPTSVAKDNITNQSFKALKTSFPFLATPLVNILLPECVATSPTPQHGAPSPGVPRQTPRSMATPQALKRLGDRVRGEWMALYADSSEEDSADLGPQMLRF